MPLIKDKYKGARTRSKFITRKENKAIIEESYVTKTESKPIAETPKASASVSAVSPNLGKIIGVIIPTVNSVKLISTLISGETLKDIIITHYHATESTRIGLYWSSSPPEDLTFTVSDGVITTTTGGKVYRLLLELFPPNASLSLSDSIHTFSNISKDIYIYAVSSVIGPELTIIKE
jgi:hypothetical protein